MKRSKCKQFLPTIHLHTVLLSVNKRQSLPNDYVGLYTILEIITKYKLIIYYLDLSGWAGNLNFVAVPTTAFFKNRVITYL